MTRTRTRSQGQGQGQRDITCKLEKKSWTASPIRESDFAASADPSLVKRTTAIAASCANKQKISHSQTQGTVLSKRAQLLRKIISILEDKKRAAISLRRKGSALVPLERVRTRTLLRTVTGTEKQ